MKAAAVCPLAIVETVAAGVRGSAPMVRVAEATATAAVARVGVEGAKVAEARAAGKTVVEVALTATGAVVRVVAVRDRVALAERAEARALNTAARAAHCARQPSEFRQELLRVGRAGRAGAGSVQVGGRLTTERPNWSLPVSIRPLRPPCRRSSTPARVPHLAASTYASTPSLHRRSRRRTPTGTGPLLRLMPCTRDCP